MVFKSGVFDPTVFKVGDVFSSMEAASEGLYAVLYLADGESGVGTQNPVGMLTGIGLGFKQEHRRRYPAGSLEPDCLFDGEITWEGSFRRAFYTNHFLAGVGTHRFFGSLCPRGTVYPAIMGTLVLTGGRLSGMGAEGVDPVTEEQGFILYNVHVAS